MRQSNNYLKKEKKRRNEYFYVAHISISRKLTVLAHTSKCVEAVSAEDWNAGHQRTNIPL
jgi:hypothetical protein